MSLRLVLTAFVLIAALIFVGMLLAISTSPLTEFPCATEDTQVRLCIKQYGCDQNKRLYTAAGHDFLAADDLLEEGLAPLTRVVQHYIWSHQHLAHNNCANASFVVHASTFGLGAQMHRAAAVLAYSLDVGKVFVWNKSAGWAYVNDNAICEVGNWLCFFKPPSNCSPDVHAYKNNNTVELSEPAVWTGVPKEINKWLQVVAPHMNRNAVRLWWNAQCVAYLMRLNERTIEALAELRKADGMVNVSAAMGSEASVAVLQSKPLWPLPAGTISLHVRHGDKAKEMTLVPFTQYQEAAVKLATMQTLTLHKRIFVSTEDPDVVAALVANGTHGWVGLYSDIPRLNDDGRKQMKLAMNMGHLHLLQLLMALECDAWVGTRHSNWAALIDELRCVWVAKCAMPFVEVGLQKDWQGLFSISSP